MATLGERDRQPGHDRGRRSGGHVQQPLDDGPADIEVTEDGRETDHLEVGMAQRVGDGQGIVDVGTDVGVDPEAHGPRLPTPFD